MEGKIPITLGTIPIASSVTPTAPAAITTPTQPPLQDPSQAPTQPVSPASPNINGSAGLPGWNMGNLYPSIRKNIQIFTHCSNQIKFIFHFSSTNLSGNGI